ncbi:subtype B tannase [Martelella limonii]|uniref:subtype B tannase n=1 Tax=Martelella limonii TaxID=1647649 RepID=UPI0015811BD0|nr:subtype B tannase [Martelella limonii]
MLTRRTLLKSGAACTSYALVGCIGLPNMARAQDNSLVFDPEDYETLTTTVSTAGGDVTVIYRFWRAIPYVARPVDADYQSLNVSVPIKIDGADVDASTAPILLANAIGGYLPSKVSNADGIGGGGFEMPEGMPEPAPPTEGGVVSGSGAQMAASEMVSNAKLGLAAGLVVVEPGARGRTQIDAAGVYYGVAPAAIVDLKAAVRFIRANAGRIPGNVERIVSSGSSAGGALSALLGASGDSAIYQPYLQALGAAEASDAIFATGAWCPITDLEHADGAYEWCWGSNPTGDGQTMDAALSAALADDFATYQQGLGVHGHNDFGPLTAKTFGPYLVETYLKPAATAYLSALSETDRSTYLAANKMIAWENGAAQFDWSGFVTHVGTRRKTLPAFDAFDLSAGENNLFGLGTQEARHFTAFSAARATAGDTVLADDIPEKLRLMNPMPFLAEANPARSKNWWIRTGSSDTDTSLSVVGNLAAMSEKNGDSVNLKLYWDSGHGANEDAEDFIAWIKSVAA